MSAKELGNAPAYPVVGAPGAPEDYPGLTKREAFAMAALTGLLAGEYREWSSGDQYTVVARNAFAYADAMLDEAGR